MLSLLSITLIVFSFLLNCSSSLQPLYSEARQVRTLQGHDQALPLYKEILRLNPNDVTAATRIAADKRSPQRHERFGKNGDRIQHQRFTKLLRSFDFDCNSVVDLVFANDATKATKAKKSSSPLFLQPLRAGKRPPLCPTTPLGACIHLFLLAVCLPTNVCVDLLGNEFVELIETLGIAYQSNNLLVPYVHIFPVSVCDKTLYLATDLHPNVLSLTSFGNSKDRNSSDECTLEDSGAVMYIGPDSLALIDHWSCHQHVNEADSIVDIGCGSGIQALSLALRSSGKAKVKCVDINKRALRFTKFNFECNDFEAPSLILGNINSPSGRIFESESTPKSWKELLRNSATYVVCNPPFLPVPDKDDVISSRYGLFSSGGSNGEDVLKSIIRLAPALLDRYDPSATIAIVSEFMNPNVDFELRLSSWWSDSTPAKALLLTNKEALDASTYAQRRADSMEELSKWEHHLQQEGIKSISPGLLLLKRDSFIGDTKSENKTKRASRDTPFVDLTQHFVPKTSEGSIWTPTNLHARNFTRYHIEKF